MKIVHHIEFLFMILILILILKKNQLDGYVTIKAESLKDLKNYRLI